MERKIRRGEIYIADLDPIVGSEQGGERPVLIVQNNIGNRYSPTVIVLAITSRVGKKRYQPTHIQIECNGLSTDSVVLVEQIRTIDKSRLMEYVGNVSKEKMDNIDKALKISVGENG